MSKEPVFELCDLVRETGFAIHSFLGPGHLERVYEEALVHRLRKLGLVVERQVPLVVYDEDGTPLGEFFADILVEKILLLELKAAKCLADEHIAQILGYLRASTLEHGLLLNFGAAKFEIRKFIASKNALRTDSTS